MSVLLGPSEPAAHAAAFLPAAVAAVVAHGEVALALLPDAIWHLCEKRHETWARCSSQAFHPLLVWREHQGSPWGKHIHLNFNLLSVIGLIHSVNWTYHPRFHWHFLMCHNWSVIAPCLLQLLHLLMNYAHLGATPSHPDKTFTANKQMKWV